MNRTKSEYQSNPHIEKEEPHYILDNNGEFTNQKVYCGKIGEMGIKAAINIACPTKKGYNIKCNDFSSQYQYCCSQGMDIIVQDKINGYSTIAAIEVKNLKNQDRPYGTDFVVNEVLPRANGLNPHTLKILTITSLNLLTRKAIALLHQQKWVIIEVEEQITKEFFKSPKLFSLAQKIKNVIPKRAKIISKCKTVSSNSKNRIQLHNTITNYIIKNNITTIHDTPKLEEYSVENFWINLAEIRENIERGENFG